MKKAIIFYRSKTGITKKLGENIRKYLEANGVSTVFKSTDEFNGSELPGFDYVFLGCWTAGLMLFLQRPDKSWIEFSKKLPALDPGRTVLFTTYKLRTGTMFRNMKKYLVFDNKDTFTEIKSRNSELSEENKTLINNLLKM